MMLINARATKLYREIIGVRVFFLIQQYNCGHGILAVTSTSIKKNGYSLCFIVIMIDFWNWHPKICT
jgi:hypothetical protein